MLEQDNQTFHFNLRNQLYFSQKQVSTLLQIINTIAGLFKFNYHILVKNREYILLIIEMRYKTQQKLKLKRNKPFSIDDKKKNQILHEALLGQRNVINIFNELDLKRLKTNKYVEISLEHIRIVVEK